MEKPATLPATFYERPVLEVARGLLGMRLVHNQNGQRTAGYITETEAYRGEEDLACHARAGRTPRTEVMYGPAGHAYVYFTYGMHWMLNCVTGPENYPAAVLIRAIEPSEGLERIAERRGNQARRLWCNGPAKLTQALGIDGSLNNTWLCSPQGELKIEYGFSIPDAWIHTGPRVGIERVPEPWLSMPWRFLARLPEKWETRVGKTPNPTV